MEKENETRTSLSSLSSAAITESGPIQIPSVPGLVNDLKIAPTDPSSVIEPLLSNHQLDLASVDTQSIIESTKYGDENKLLGDPLIRPDLPADSITQEISHEPSNSIAGSAWNRPQTAAPTLANDTQVMIVNLGVVSAKEGDLLEIKTDLTRDRQKSVISDSRTGCGAASCHCRPNPT